MTTIHILHHGFPLCGFTEVLPGDWPEGHRWVSKITWGSMKMRKRGEDDPEAERVEQCICPTCVARMEEEIEE